MLFRLAFLGLGIAPAVKTKGEKRLLLVTLPGRAASEVCAKDAVVSVLADNWPLSLKEIYFCVVKQHGMTVSQQAVFKALNQLVEKKVLEKKERRYSISLEWIRQVKRFGLSLEKAYAREESTQGLNKFQPREYKPTKIGILSKKERRWHASGRNPGGI